MEAGNYDIVASIRRARPRRETHGPLATKIAQVRRYVQCHPLSAYRDGRQPIYDGVALTWFDNTADMREKRPSTAPSAATNLIFSNCARKTSSSPRST